MLIQLMRYLLSNQATDVMKAILINIALEKRNAQLICGQEGQGLDLLIELVYEQKDLLILKILRNIASHSGPSQSMFNVIIFFFFFFFKFQVSDKIVYNQSTLIIA